jgi:hypothetical protein
VDEVWPKIEPKRLVFTLLSDQNQLIPNGSGLLTGREIAAIAWPKPPRGPASAPWTRADQVLIDEAADLIERTPSIAHIVVDEAQDLSPMEARAIGRRCATGAATVLGDIAQGTTPWAATSWPALLEHLGKPDAAVRELDIGYRVPRQILDFASRLLPSIAPGLAPAQSLRADPDALTVVPVAAGKLGERVAAGCLAALARPGSVAVICADPHIQETAESLRAAGLAFSILGSPGDPGHPGDPENADRLTLVPVTLAKGLEFDHVVLVEPGQIATGEAYGLRRLYVALTRAVSRLTVFHAEPLPAELSLHTIGATFQQGDSVEAKGNHAAATVYLDKLAEELTNRGLEAWLMAPPGRVPSVYITNPGARALEENVYVDQGKDGLFWFWWSWAERISIADDLDAAATAITHVLR